MALPTVTSSAVAVSLAVPIALDFGLMKVGPEYRVVTVFMERPTGYTGPDRLDLRGEDPTDLEAIKNKMVALMDLHQTALRASPHAVHTGATSIDQQCIDSERGVFPRSYHRNVPSPAPFGSGLTAAQNQFNDLRDSIASVAKRHICSHLPPPPYPGPPTIPAANLTLFPVTHPPSPSPPGESPTTTPAGMSMPSHLPTANPAAGLLNSVATLSSTVVPSTVTTSRRELELVQRNQQLERQVADLMEQLREHKNVEGSLRNDQASLREELRVVRQELQETKRTIERTSKDKEDLEANLRKMQDLIKQVRSDKTATQEQLDEQLAKTRKQSAQIETLERDLKDKNEELLQLRSDKGTHESTLNQKDEEIDRLDSTRKLLIQKRDEQEKTLKELEESIHVMDRDLKSSQEEVRTLKSRLTDLDRERGVLLEARNDLQTRNQELLARQKALTDQVETQQARIDVLEEEKTGLQAKQGALKRKNAELEEVVKSHRDTIEKREETLRLAKEEISKQLELIRAQSKELEDADERDTRLRSEITSLRLEKEQLKRKIKKLKQANQGLRDKKRVLTTALDREEFSHAIDVDQTKADRNSALEELKATRKSLSKKEKALNEALREIRESKAARHESESTVASQKKEITTLKEKIGVLTAESADVLKEKERLEAKVREMNEQGGVLEKQLLELQEKAKSIMDTAQSTFDLANSLREQNERLVLEKKLTEQQIETLTKRQKAILTEHAELVDTLNQATAETIRALKEDHSEALKQMQTEIDFLRDYVKTKDTALEISETHVLYLKGQIELLNQQLIEMERGQEVSKEHLREIPELRLNIQKLNDELEKASIKESVLRSEITDLNTQINGLMKQIDTAGTREEGLQSEIRSLRRQKSELDDRIAKSGKKIKKLIGQNKRLHEKNQTQVKNASALREELLLEQEKITGELKKLCHNQKQELSDLKSRVSDILGLEGTEEQTGILPAIEAQQQRFQSILKEITAVRAENQDLRLLAKNLESQLNELKGIFDIEKAQKARNDLDLLNSFLKIVHQEINESNLVLKELQETLDAAKSLESPATHISQDKADLEELKQLILERSVITELLAEEATRLAEEKAMDREDRPRTLSKDEEAELKAERFQYRKYWGELEARKNFLTLQLEAQREVLTRISQIGHIYENSPRSHRKEELALIEKALGSPQKKPTSP